MNKLQKTILIIASEIKKICDENDIKYYIAFGTLLGAVRHKGFIPWDDDFDIAMKRDDFEHFIRLCQTELDTKKFYLQWEGNEKYYAFEFAKIQLNDTEVIQNFCLNVPIHNGIFVDVFPFDNLPDNRLKRFFLKMENFILKNLIWIKCGYGAVTHGDLWWYKLGKIVSRLFSLKWLKRKRYKVITKYRSADTKECFISDYPREGYLNSWLKKFRIYDFENCQFSGIEKYDECLTMLFGNYMKMPPENERKSHVEQEINYGPYDE